MSGTPKPKHGYSHSMSVYGHRRNITNTFLGAKHELETVGDMDITETVRDIIDDEKQKIPSVTLSPKIKHVSSKSDTFDFKETYLNSYGRVVFDKLNIKDNDNLKKRVSAIINEIDMIDNFQKQEHKSEQKLESDFDDDSLVYNNQQREEQQKKLMQSDEYQQLKQQFNKEMGHILRVEKHSNVNKKYKTKKDLKTECAEISHSIPQCESIKRIIILLQAYQSLMKRPKLWSKVPIAPLLSFNDIYDFQQVVNDFIHLKYHVNKNKQLANIICEHFERQIKCKTIAKCEGFLRHYRDRTQNKDEQDLYFRPYHSDNTSTKESNINNKDIVYQQECDKIHSYFLHSLVKYNKEDLIGAEKLSEQRSEEINVSASGRSFSKQIKPIQLQTKSSPTLGIGLAAASAAVLSPRSNNKNNKIYLGKTEDENWWNELNCLDDEKELRDEGGYKLLVEKMGIFRYQSAHGFRFRQYRALNHLKPKYKNIKQEVMKNEYYKVSVDNWNQTLRKAKAFFNSWAKSKIRTSTNYMFDDKVAGVKSYWNKGEEINMQEIVALKLYTDFDKLQFELKKCFRWETIAGIFKNGADKKQKDADHKAMRNLEQRLSEFYYWRCKLLLVLNKYGESMNDKELFHGVNAKMILNPAETPAFYGPLSTSSSYHVAKTFATAKGMVLKITTQYPRLNMCSAFDASVISDYPEEQEWLIGFIYLRVLEIRTRPITIQNDLSELRIINEDAPIASFTRAVFFAIHLFREQMFSMSDHLEKYLQMFIELHLLKKEDFKRVSWLGIKKTEKKVRKAYGDWLKKQVINEYKTKYNVGTDKARRQQILKILWDKFNDFRLEPNLKQTIKIDSVSEALKQYFFDENGYDVRFKSKKKWIVSFSKIIKVFENVEEIHFINSYKFDDKAMNKLIKHIKKDTNKLKRIKFLYYNYKDNKDKIDRNRPPNSNSFYNPNDMPSKLIANLANINWEFKYGNNGRTGYKIRLFEKEQQK